MNKFPLLATLKPTEVHCVCSIRTLSGQLVMRAQLPLIQPSPRNLLNLLEAVGEATGSRIYAVVFAAESSIRPCVMPNWVELHQWAPSNVVRVLRVGPDGRGLLPLTAIGEGDKP
jgi:hypothetical protein